MARPCSVDGCGKNARSLGMCGAHYARNLRYGSATAGQPLRAPRAAPSDIDGFVIDAIRSTTGYCISWPFATFKATGYGQIMLGAHRGGGDLRPVGAHVYVCTLAHGIAPREGMEVAHGCGNRLCVNPRHLRWDTRANNHADKVTHGTMARGARNGATSLEPEDVDEIMALKGALSQRQIAKRFGVGKTTIARIHRGETWSFHTSAKELADG